MEKISNSIVCKQNYYTTCRLGLGSGSGWQTKAQSDGIDQITRRLIEKQVGAYNTPPPGYSDAGSVTLPSSFKSFSLGEGQWCISLSQFVEKTWQGRSGSFFAHSLICKQEDLKILKGNPFSVLRTNCFVKLNPEELPESTELPDITIVPKPIPLISVLDKLLQAFPEKSRLITFLDAIIFSKSLNGPVILVMDLNQVETVMEGILMLLPLPLRLTISFSTYELDPYPVRDKDPNINSRLESFTCKNTISSGASSFKFSLNEYEREYLIFNFIESRFSDISKHSSYSDWICELLFNKNYSEIEKFLDFSDSYQFSSDSLDTVVDFYKIEYSIETKTREQINNILKFIRTQNTDSQIVKSYQKLLTIKAASAYDMELAILILELEGKHPALKVPSTDTSNRIIILLRNSINTGGQHVTELLDAIKKNFPTNLKVRLVKNMNLSWNSNNSRYSYELYSISFSALSNEQNFEHELYENYQNALINIANIGESEVEVAKKLINLATNLSNEKQILLAIEVSQKISLSEIQVILFSTAFEVLQRNPQQGKELKELYEAYQKVLKMALERNLINDQITAQLVSLLNKLQHDTQIMLIKTISSFKGINNYLDQIVAISSVALSKEPNLETDVYEIYQNALIVALDTGDKRNVELLLKRLERIPPDKQILIIKKLASSKGTSTYLNQIMKISFDLLQKDYSFEPDIYEIYRSSLNNALRDKELAVAQELLKLKNSLSSEKQILLSTEISSDNGIKEVQIPIFKKALESIQMDSNSMKQIYKKLIYYFNWSLKNRELGVAIELFKYIDRLPLNFMMNFYDEFYNKRLDDLLSCINYSNSKDEKDFFQLWLPKALEYERVVDLDHSLSKKWGFEFNDLKGELNRVEIKNYQVINEFKKANEILWFIKDDKNKIYIVVKNDKQLIVYLYAPEIIENRIQHVIKYILKLNNYEIKKFYGQVCCSTVRLVIESGRFLILSIDFFEYFLDFVAQISISNKENFLLQVLLPIVKESNDSNMFKAFIKGAIKLYEPGMNYNKIYQLIEEKPNNSFKVLEDLAEQQDIRIIVEWYKKLIERHKPDVQMKLVELYNDNRFALFMEIFEWDISRLRMKHIERSSLKQFIKHVNKRDDFYEKYFPKMLDLVLKHLSSSSHNAIIDLYKSLSDDLDYKGALIFGERLVRDIVITNPLDMEEERLIIEWIKANPNRKSFINRFNILKELQQLPVSCNNLQEAKEYLKNYLKGKDFLDSKDFFEVIQKKILPFIAGSTPSWNMEWWHVFEELIQRSDNINDLFLKDFFNKCIKRRDFQNILATATQKWIEDGRFNRQKADLLFQFYEKIDKIKKHYYNEKIKFILKTELQKIQQTDELKELKQLVDPKSIWSRVTEKIGQTLFSTYSKQDNPEQDNQHEDRQKKGKHRKENRKLK